MKYLKTRWPELSRGRRIILLLQPVLFFLCLAVFFALGQGQWQVVSHRGGYLRYEQQGDTAVYFGREDGHKVQYAVSPGPVVEFWLDGALDSVYTVTEDPTAIPQIIEDAADFLPDFLVGVEIRKDGEVWFRGAYSRYSPHWLVDEAGNDLNLSFPASGEPAPNPAPGTILSFADGPEVSRRGYGPGILLGLLVSLACAASLLFEDQRFRWQMSFRVQNPDDVEPSEWELFGRWVEWIALTGFALVLYALSSGLIPLS